MQLFKNLFSALNEQSVKYLVGGGVAVNLYGIERATADIDIVLKIDEKNLSKFITVAKKLGLKSKLPLALDDLIDGEKRKSWTVDKDMVVYGLYDAKNPFFLLDIFVEEPFNFDEVYEERKIIEFGNTVIPLVPIKALIAMKERSDRPQDKADGRPLLYHKTREDIDTHRKKSVELKLQWLEAQMEFFYKAMPGEAKRIREKLKRGEI